MKAPCGDESILNVAGVLPDVAVSIALAMLDMASPRNTDQRVAPVGYHHWPILTSGGCRRSPACQVWATAPRFLPGYGDGGTASSRNSGGNRRLISSSRSGMACCL